MTTEMNQSSKRDQPVSAFSEALFWPWWPTCPVPFISPEAPARDSDGHNDIEDNLGKEDEEECKEVERAITPVETEVHSLMNRQIAWFPFSLQVTECLSSLNNTNSIIFHLA